MPRRIATAPAITISACPLISNAIMIGPLLDNVTGLTSKPSSLKNPAPRATAVGSPVFQLGETKATVTTWRSAAKEKFGMRTNGARIIEKRILFMGCRLSHRVVPAIIEKLSTHFNDPCDDGCRLKR